MFVYDLGNVRWKIMHTFCQQEGKPLKVIATFAFSYICFHENLDLFLS